MFFFSLVIKVAVSSLKLINQIEGGWVSTASRSATPWNHLIVIHWLGAVGGVNKRRKDWQEGPKEIILKTLAPGLLLIPNSALRTKYLG